MLLQLSRRRGVPVGDAVTHVRTPWRRYLLPGVLALAMLALLLRLGFWQLSRAEYKEQLEARWRQADAADVLRLDGDTALAPATFQKAMAVGVFEPERQFLLDNRTDGGRAGYHVLTPLRLGASAILVNRGWVAVGADRAVLPDLLPLPAGRTQISGLLAPPPRSGLVLGATGHVTASNWPRVVQTVDAVAMGDALGMAVLPSLLLLEPESPACHRCIWRPVVGMPPGTHRGYAFQWFSLAAALVLLCAFAFRWSLRRGD